MIVLTGDIHHSSLKTGNQRASDIPEAVAAQHALRFAEEAGVKLTYFISGRTLAEEWELVKPLCISESVELGGHNWSCFQPAILHRACLKLTGSYNGPAWMQRRDARRTIDIIRQRTGRRIRCWRNHMYMHGPGTERALQAEGIEVVSDGVRRASTGPEAHPDGIVTFPINVIPDHEHLFHAERTPAWVSRWQRRYGWSDDFGPASYFIHEWIEMVIDQVRRNEAAGAVSNLIVHPITMYLADGFAAYRRLIDFLADYETVWMSEAAAAPRVAEGVCA